MNEGLNGGYRGAKFPYPSPFSHMVLSRDANTEFYVPTGRCGVVWRGKVW